MSDEIKYQLEMTNGTGFDIEEAKRNNDRQMEEESFQNANKAKDKLESLSKRVDDYYCEGNIEYKKIIALNEIFGRDKSQHTSYSLQGISENITRGVPNNLLEENGYQLSSNGVLSRYVAYIKVVPEMYYVDEAAISLLEELTNLERGYSARNRSVLIRVFINTKDYITYKTTENSLETFPFNIEIVSKYPSQDILEKGYLCLNNYPKASPQDIIANISSAFDIFDKRRESIYINNRMPTASSDLSVLDLNLIAHSQLVNFVIEDSQRAALANHYRDYWLSDDHLKFLNESFIDFFDAPKLVLVRGVAALWGLIIERSIEMDCVKLSLEGEPEESYSLTLKTSRDVEGIYDHDLLTKYLSLSVENTRDKLVKIQGEVYRVERFSRTLVIQGRNELVPVGAGKRAVLSRVEVTDMTKVVFLTDYYDLAGYFAKSRERDYGINNPLPINIRSYLLRRIVIAGGQIITQGDREEAESFEWFNPKNSQFRSTLKKISESFPISAALGPSLSASEGIISPKLTMKWEDLLCLQVH